LNLTTRTLAPCFSTTTSPVTFADCSALGSTVTLPSWFTRSTCLNSTDSPWVLPRRSTLITCPGVTRYCLPPVLITPSITSTPSLRSLQPGWGFAAKAHEPTPRPDKSRSAPTCGDGTGAGSGDAEIAREALTQEQPRAVHARLHRGQADPQRLGDLRVREPLHVGHEEGGAIVLGQIVDHDRQHLAERVLQSRL